MIVVSNLTKKYAKKARAALDSINFIVTPGETVALLGENGAGKTTLIRVLSSIVKPTSGNASVCGYDTAAEPLRARANIGVLFSGAGIYDRLTARENILYFAGLHGMDTSRAHARLEKISLMLGMDSFLDRRASTFSGGMKQKTSIARAIIHDPEIIIFDEPSTGLDMSSAGIIRDFILEVRASGKTVIFSSHNASEIEKCADRILIMHKAAIAEDSPMDAFKIKYGEKVENAFFQITGARR